MKYLEEYLSLMIAKMNNKPEVVEMSFKNLGNGLYTLKVVRAFFIYFVQLTGTFFL